MRIVHTCLRYPPATGGVETYVKEIVERTRIISERTPTDSGFESRRGDASDTRDVRVLTSKMRTHGPISELDPNLLLDDPMYVQRLHHARTPIFSYPRLQALRYYIGHHKPDILESYSFWYQPADVTARHARRHRIPFIFHPIFYTRTKPFWRLYQATIGQQTFAAADIVAVISPFEQELIQKAGLPVKRFELLPPGVDSDQFNHSRPNPFLGAKLTGKIILAVSRIAPGKGLEDLLAAWPEIARQHPDAHLVIIGEDFGLRSDLEHIVRQRNLTKTVHFWGKVDGEKLRAAYQHATVLVHPSHYEAFGIVVAEALAAGIPVVARNVGSIPFVAPPQRTSLLFNNQTELIQSISTLLKDENLRAQLGDAGAKHIRQNFTWEKSIKKLLKLYEELKGK